MTADDTWHECNEQAEHEALHGIGRGRCFVKASEESPWFSPRQWILDRNTTDRCRCRSTALQAIGSRIQKTV